MTTTIEYTLNGKLLNREIFVNQSLSEASIKNALHTLCLTDMENSKMTREQKCFHMKNVAWAEVFNDGVYLRSHKILEKYNG